MDADPTIETRYDEAGLRHLLRDAELLAERVALCVETGDPGHAREYAEWTAPLYRRRGTPMDDVVALCEGPAGRASRASSPRASCRSRPRRSTRRSSATAGTGGSPATRARRTRSSSSSTRAAERMTIKWVQQDPLVLNGEPFCYGSRLTVRQLLELRANGYDLTRILKDHPELRVLGIAAAYVYAAGDRERYADFFEADGIARRPRLHGRRGGRPARPVPRPGRRHRARARRSPATVRRRAPGAAGHIRA